MWAGRLQESEGMESRFCCLYLLQLELFFSQGGRLCLRISVRCRWCSQNSSCSGGVSQEAQPSADVLATKV